MKIILLLYLNIGISIFGYCQEIITPANFLESFFNESTDSRDGEIECGVRYLQRENGKTIFDLYGDARISLIHKSTPKNWLLVANRKFADSCKELSYWCATKYLFNNHKNLFNDFDIYIYMVDKKYLDVGYESAESGEPLAYYYPKINKDYEAVLYKKSANQNIWEEIDKKTFNSGEYGYYVHVNDWLEVYNDKVVKQSNSNFIPLRKRVFRNSFITDHLLNTSTKEELSKLRKQELRILRNAYFARLGYKFKSENLQEFFNQFDWYKKIVGAFPNDFYTLTKEEKNRVDLIRNLENSK